MPPRLAAVPTWALGKACPVALGDFATPSMHADHVTRHLVDGATFVCFHDSISAVSSKLYLKWNADLWEVGWSLGRPSFWKRKAPVGDLAGWD